MYDIWIIIITILGRVIASPVTWHKHGKFPDQSMRTVLDNVLIMEIFYIEHRIFYVPEHPICHKYSVYHCPGWYKHLLQHSHSEISLKVPPNLAHISSVSLPVMNKCVSSANKRGKQNSVTWHKSLIYIKIREAQVWVLVELHTSSSFLSHGFDTIISYILNLIW